MRQGNITAKGVALVYFNAEKPRIYRKFVF